MRRISASASRPVRSTIRSASRSRSCSGLRSRRTADACTVITLTLWPTTSCSSRAIRARSSATARCARSSRSRSARAARSFASSVSTDFRPTPNAIDQTMVKMMLPTMKFPTADLGSLWTTTATTLSAMAKPATAWARSRSEPTRKSAAHPTINTTPSKGTTVLSTNEIDAAATPIATGAPNGKRRRASRGRTITSIARTSNQSGPSGPIVLSRPRTAPVTPMPVRPRIMASNQ